MAIPPSGPSLGDSHPPETKPTERCNPAGNSTVEPCGWIPACALRMVNRGTGAVMASAAVAIAAK
jgi:hypothetical protein